MNNEKISNTFYKTLIEKKNTLKNLEMNVDRDAINGGKVVTSCSAQILAQINRKIAECFDCRLFLTCIILNARKSHGGLFEGGGLFVRSHLMGGGLFERRKANSKEGA